MKILYFITLQHLNGSTHFDSIFFDHGFDDLTKVSFSNHIFKLNVLPPQYGIGEGLG